MIDRRTLQHTALLLRFTSSQPRTAKSVTAAFPWYRGRRDGQISRSRAAPWRLTTFSTRQRFRSSTALAFRATAVLRSLGGFYPGAVTNALPRDRRALHAPRRSSNAGLVVVAFLLERHTVMTIWGHETSPSRARRCRDVVHPITEENDSEITSVNRHGLADHGCIWPALRSSDRAVGSTEQ